MLILSYCPEILSELRLHYEDIEQTQDCDDDHGKGRNSYTVYHGDRETGNETPNHGSEQQEKQSDESLLAVLLHHHLSTPHPNYDRNQIESTYERKIHDELGKRCPDNIVNRIAKPTGEVDRTTKAYAAAEHQYLILHRYQRRTHHDEEYELIHTICKEPENQAGDHLLASCAIEQSSCHPTE